MEKLKGQFHVHTYKTSSTELSMAQCQARQNIDNFG